MGRWRVLRRRLAASGGSCRAPGRSHRSPRVELVEAYVSQGKLKGAQLKKAADDAARLMLARVHVKGAPRLRLAWASLAAIEQMQASWRGQALEAMGVEFVHVDLDDETEASIRDAQVRQYR